MPHKMHDVRLVPHHIRRRTLDRKVHQKHLDGLEDVAHMGEPTVTRFLPEPEPPVEPEAPTAE